MANNPFDFTQHMRSDPAQATGSGGGGGKGKRKNKKPNRPNRNPGGGGGGGGNADAPFDEEGYETDFWLENPQEAFAGFAGEQGFNMQGSDALANWMNAQYDTLYTDWKGGTLDAANREQTFQDYLSGLGGGTQREGGPQPLEPLAGPPLGPAMLGIKTGLGPGRAPRIPGPARRPAESGPGSDFYDEMMRRYQMSTLESKGLNYSPYEGFSRWLAF